ncbi:MAG TPA: ABC transporter ATP-binding protein [Actinomycetota bacterium]|nr:ABC transporter ATP-binding protein [Actinomycetota bacterium]
MAEVLLDDVSRVHADGAIAVAGLTLHVRHGELLTLVGPSGSGKSTTLRLIAGLEPVTSGTIAIGGRVVNDLPPQQRNVAMVFEGESLYPHLTAGGNLRFGLEVGRVPKQEIDLRVQAESRVLGVAGLLNLLPKALSAGQRQRVAVGRATVRVPAVFLLDEPLTHLDAAQRHHLRAELVRFLRGLTVTALYVTHDQTQAMAIGDRIGVLRAGRLEQVGRPGELYRRPANTFVASFLGTPGMSLIVARLERDAEGDWIVIGGQRLGFPGVPSGPLRSYLGRQVVLGLRPEHASDGRLAPESAARRRLCLTAVRVEHLGPELLVACAVDAPTVQVHDPPEARPADTAWSAEGVGGATLLARFPRHAAVHRGERVDVAVDVAQLSYFDPVSGAALWHPA